MYLMAQWILSLTTAQTDRVRSPVRENMLRQGGARTHTGQGGFITIPYFGYGAPIERAVYPDLQPRFKT